MKNDENLNQYILGLAESCYAPYLMVERSKVLHEIYRESYRHSYSQIFATMLYIKKAEHLDFLALSANIETFKTYIIVDPQFSDIRRSLEKLYDHISLEIARINFLTGIDEQQATFKKQIEQDNQELNKMRTYADNMKQEIHDTAKEVKKTSKDMENLKLDVITIIGVFTAIILAFVSGMTFTSSTLTSMHNSSIYKVAFMSVICGFVVFNTIASLLYFISRITGKSIYSKCKDGECISEACDKDCTFWGKTRKRLPYVFWINSACAALLVIIGFSWMIEVKNLAEFTRIWVRIGLGLS